MKSKVKTVSISIKEAKEELHKKVEKTQVSVTIIAAALQLPWILSDYFILHDKWKLVLFLRIIAFIIPVGICLVRKQLKISASMCMFVAALTISVLDAVIANIIPENEFKSFSIGYVVLFIGIGMLAVWDLIYSVLLVIISIALNAILFYLYSPISLKDYIVDGEMSIFIVAIISIVMVNIRYQLNISEIKSRLELERSKQFIEEQQEEVLSSIRYGKRIQDALLKEEADLKDLFPDHFIIYKPKDIVSGDFFWTARKEHWLYVAVGDCTGHGVPGAFLTMFGTSFLNDIVGNSKERLKPGEILDALRNKVLKDISSKSKETENRDGMDISMIAVNTLNGEFEWSGANNPLWIAGNFNGNHPEACDANIQKFEKTEILEIRGDKQPIGFHDRMKPFSNVKFRLEKGQMVYLFSDGYSDQFGGAKAKKLRASVMKEIVAKISHLRSSRQRTHLESEHDTWKGGYAQVDDICILGFRF
ncbi:MAG: PP2C family protein-serine/threonine phosphatase [Bacteroidota bacterium]|jgi:hypothetical protein